MQENANTQVSEKILSFVTKAQLPQLGAESQWATSLQVSGSPPWQSLCSVRIALPFLAACDNSSFFTNWIQSLHLIPVTALTFWNVNFWQTACGPAPNYREGISVHQYPCSFFRRLDTLIASLCQSPWQLGTRHLGYIFKYSYFQLFSN